MYLLIKIELFMGEFLKYLKHTDFYGDKRNFSKNYIYKVYFNQAAIISFIIFN